MGKWQDRSRRWLLPAGVLLLFLYVAWVGWALVAGWGAADLSVGRAIIGLLTAVLIIGSGFYVRRHPG